MVLLLIARTMAKILSADISLGGDTPLSEESGCPANDRRRQYEILPVESRSHAQLASLTVLKTVEIWWKG